EVGDGPAAQVMQRVYDIGMQPDWWKLEPSGSARAWRNIEAVIQRNDRWCRGGVLLGLSAPQAELVASFVVAARPPMVKGFAVGRTIFADVAERWLLGEIDDEAAISDLARRFGTLVDAWDQARAGTTRDACREPAA